MRRLGLDPVDGHFYLFRNRRRRLAKALWFDGSGWSRAGVIPPSLIGHGQQHNPGPLDTSERRRCRRRPNRDVE